MRKEIRTGLLLGLILGTLGFARVGLWNVFTNLYGEHWLYIGLTIGCFAHVCSCVGNDYGFDDALYFSNIWEPIPLLRPHPSLLLW
jgi:hypothetical protein